MLMLMPIVLALAAAAPVPAGTPAPSASTAPKPTPLTEIGRVRALPACVPIVAHANGAISQALDNDRTLAIITTNLHNTDFDKLNFLQRRNAIDALLKQAETMRMAARSADGEIKKLREYAKASPDPKRQAELKAFADALGGALYRQNKAATEFVRDITIMRGREEAADARAIMNQDNRLPPAILARAQAGQDPTTTNGSALPPAAPTYNKQMQYLGDTLDDLVNPILVDEGVAADHSIAATSGC